MDIVLQWLGGALGFVMIRIFFSRKTLTAQPMRNNAFSQGEYRHTHKTRRKKVSEIS
jgi:hypothetical protein